MGVLDWFKREVVEPPALERTNSDQLQAQIDAFWDSLRGAGFSPRLIERVWVAARCLQLNAQQIASMPLRWTGAPSATEPAWVSNPDPSWFPNGIGDAVFYAIKSMYAWGDAFLYVISRYASTGFPDQWTVLDPSVMTVEVDDRGRRTFKSGDVQLNPSDVVQVSRDPGGVRGTSALAAYGAQMYGALAGSDLSRSIQEGGVPTALIKSARKLEPGQAEQIKNAWALATASRRGEPAVLGPELDYVQLSFSPQDLELLASQEFNARVIASAFGVPPFMLNLPLTGGLTYQNPAMLGEMWWRFELRPAALRLSRAMTAQMLPRGTFVAFDAHDTFAPLVSETGEPSTQEQEDSPVANASPNGQGGSVDLAALRPMAGATGG